MFGAALFQQVRREAPSGEARFGRAVAIGYTLTGIVVTALGIGMIWVGGIEEGDVRPLLYPLLAILAIWAVAAVLLIRRYTGGN
jgi:hypothetical protein